jgi:DNA modification methylase
VTEGYRLINGDCLEKMKDIPDGSVDMVLADPPYGTTVCKWDSVIPFAPMWAQLKRIAKPNAAIVLFGSQPFTSALVMSNPKMFKYEWVWEKERGTGFARANKQPMRKHENVIVFYSSPPFYDSVGEKLEKPYTHVLPVSKCDSDCVSGSGLDDKGRRIIKSYTHSKKHSMLRFARDMTKAHPTQKPVALMEYLVKTYTNEGELVLDFTMGSGTTGVACGNLNRNFIGIELDQTYFQIAEKRIAEAYNRKATEMELAL